MKKTSPANIEIEYATTDGRKHKHEVPISFVNTPPVLDRITDIVVAYKPKPKTKAAKRRRRKMKHAKEN